MPAKERRQAQRKSRANPHAPTAQNSFSDSELVIGLVCTVGTDLSQVKSTLAERLTVAGYEVCPVKITDDVLPAIVPGLALDGLSVFDRTMKLMDAGNHARSAAEHSGILAQGAVAYINAVRKRARKSSDGPKRRAYVIHSLKTPEEVEVLRQIYPLGFYLLGVHADKERRKQYLIESRRLTEPQATTLIERDEDEPDVYGQHVSDTFHKSDFFVRVDHDADQLPASVQRIVDLLLSDPFVTPTFDEFAMYLAFVASLRSADMSRQVGAVTARFDQVLSTGANDVPKAGGGLYWPKWDAEKKKFADVEGGRDYTRGVDQNKAEQQKIITDILAAATAAKCKTKGWEEVLRASAISDLTEFGRMAHAEMEALLSANRAGISLKEATVYTTTFPCHNCAKHMVTAGIRRVVYIEPYPKSKAEEFHPDSIRMGDSQDRGRIEDVVLFEPFVGVGPRRFFDLFSMRLGSGSVIRRKDSAGKKIDWTPEKGRLRLQMLPKSYLDLELLATKLFHDTLENLNREAPNGHDKVHRKEAESKNR